MVLNNVKSAARFLSIFTMRIKWTIPGVTQFFTRLYVFGHTDGLEKITRANNSKK